MALRSTASIMKGASQPPVEEEERQEAEDAPLLATDGSAAEAAERRKTPERPPHPRTLTQVPDVRG